MAIKILATGDLHLGKTSSSIHHHSSEIATKSTWQNIVNYAIENDVDVVALTGDVVDKDNRYYEAVGPLQNGFEKLNKAEIHVCVVAGNHDFEVLPQLIRNQKTSENVHFLGEKGTWETKILTIKNQKIQFIGWSFPTVHYRNNPMDSFDPTIVDAEHISIGLVHGDVGSLESSYAPMNRNDFFKTTMDAWLLGHIHKPELLNNLKPLVLYPGSPHALSPKEQGVHGPYVLTLHAKDNIELEQIPLSPVRYELLEIDCTGKNDEEAVRNTITSLLYEHANSKAAELYNVHHLVYDLQLVGKHKNIEQLSFWAKNTKDYNLEMNTTKVTVRKTQVSAEAVIENMEELAKGENIISVLAQSIIALQKGETTPFLDQLELDWKAIDDIKSAAVYAPLGRSDKSSDEESQERKQYLLQECNRILSNLLSQQ